MYTNKILNSLLEQRKLGLKGNLYHNTQIKFAYNSNRIEGSKLSLEDTRLIFETNTTPETSNNMDDLIETANHFYLFDYMLDNYNKPLSEDLIKEFHKILKRGTSFERVSWFNVGEYKSMFNEVGGMDTTEPAFVSDEIKILLDDYNKKDNITIKDIIKFHYAFERIHPFQDGNGRVGRMIMFKECLKNNIVPFIIDEKHKLYYYRGLKEYLKDDKYLVDTCLDCQDEYEKDVIKFLG